MKRSRIRRKAKKQKPWKDKAVLAAFAATYTDDMLERELEQIRTEDGKPCPLWTAFKSGWHLPNPLSICHIWHNGERVDRTGNLVRSLECGHQFTHKYPTLGAVMLMWVRVREGIAKGEDRWEIREDWDAASGYCTMPWVQDRIGQIPEQYASTARDLLEMF